MMLSTAVKGVIWKAVSELKSACVYIFMLCVYFWNQNCRMN